MLDFGLSGAVGPGIGRMTMRILIVLMLSGTLGVLGCDSTSTGGSGGSGGSAGSGGSGGEAGMGGEGGSGGGAGMGGEGGSGGATDPAAAFCAEYGVECGFDGAGYASDEDCRTAYNGYDADRQGCVETHLGLAIDTGDTGTHCPHAAGGAPCD